MEQENANPQPNPSQNISANETPQKIINNQKSNLLVVIGFFLLVLIIGGGMYFLGTINGKRALKSKQTPNPISLSQTQVSVTPTPSVKSSPSPKAGFKQYINDNLKYGFSYPQSESLYIAPDTFYLSISRISLGIETLGTEALNANDVKASLLANDLYCTADGPGSRRCENTQVKNYTNPLGYKGFKVLRTKTIAGLVIGPPTAGTYQDAVYVYLLPKVIQGRGVIDYAGIMFAVDNPSQTNLAELKTIADTFFTF